MREPDAFAIGKMRTTFMTRYVRQALMDYNMTLPSLCHHMRTKCALESAFSLLSSLGLMFTVSQVSYEPQESTHPQVLWFLSPYLAFWDSSNSYIW